MSAEDNEKPAREYIQFWGKAQADEDADVTWHPVVYHLLDVAATAQEILRARPLTLARGASLLQLTPGETSDLLVALIALHDLGKFAPVFQAKSPEHWPDALADIDPARVVKSHHTGDGYALWEHVLSNTLSESIWINGKQVLDVLAHGVFGHHGRPTNSKDALQPAKLIFGEIPLRAAVNCARDLIDLLLPEPLSAQPPTVEQARIASWWASGLVTVADWIGSNERWFNYQRPDLGIADYWLLAQKNAAVAVRETGLASPHIAPRRSFSTLTGKSAPTPSQAWASEVELPTGPVLVILEDVTGSGKTEAAQMLVHRLMADGRASGAYWAMPTMATANAMYSRQSDMVSALFDNASDEPRPSVVLAHGQARLHSGFQGTVLRHPEEKLNAAASNDPELGAAAACSAFLADNRRAALLADIGAGTVDQAILGALPSKFNTVRLFGMVDKVLIFDEAHAYDAYMDVEIRQLLRFQAALGGSAIILSATLTMKQREDFAVAWTEGLSGGRRRTQRLFAGPPAALVKSMEYPLASIVGGEGESIHEQPIEPAEWSRREVSVRFAGTEDDALQHVLSSADAGAAVVWIRNTVADCLNAAALVEYAGKTALVFHARFAQCDRQARELAVLKLFGSEGDAAARKGAILIATQVVEQSLDLDFDVMVSDLAPVDLLIQRAGRLWRHESRNAQRPAGVKCELLVLSPPIVPEKELTADWLNAVLPGTEKVYKNLGVLWLSAKALTEAEKIVTPEGLRALVEAAYDVAETPTALLEKTQAAEGEEFGNAAAAQHATLKLPGGYNGDEGAWVDEIKAPTRLSEEQTTVRLARVLQDGSLLPWSGAGGPPWIRWSLSEVRLAGWRVPFESTALPEYRKAIDTIRLDWGRFEQETIVLPLVQGEQGNWSGELVRPDNNRRIQLTYSMARGVEFA